MVARRTSSPHFAVCIDSADYPASLEMHKVYRVLPDKDAQRDGDLRVIDESGEDYLYPAKYFILVDFPRSAVRALNKAYGHAMQRGG